jgi:uncharacterized protein Usg
MAMSELELQLRDYRLTTAEIVYHMPDHPSLLQTFVWQTYDVAPRYPRVHRFLAYWETSIEGRLHSVNIASARLVKPSEMRHLRHMLQLH